MPVTYGFGGGDAARVQADLDVTSFRTVTGSGATTASDEAIAVDPSAGPVELTLHSAVSAPGGQLEIKRLAGFDVTVRAAPGELIDADAQRVLTATWESLILRSDGVRWLVF